MKIRIGSCTGPLDATLVRSYFSLHEIEMTITGCGNSLDTTLDGCGHFEQHDDDVLEVPPVRTKPFVVEDHQARRTTPIVVERPMPRLRPEVSRRMARASRFANALLALRRALRLN